MRNSTQLCMRKGAQRCAKVCKGVQRCAKVRKGCKKFLKWNQLLDFQNKLGIGLIKIMHFYKKFFILVPNSTIKVYRKKMKKLLLMCIFILLPVFSFSNPRHRRQVNISWASDIWNKDLNVCFYIFTFWTRIKIITYLYLYILSVDYNLCINIFMYWTLIKICVQLFTFWNFERGFKFVFHIYILK